MKPKPTYVVLAASGPSWQSHGPMASEYPTRDEAETAARELLARYPQRVLGVYELQSLFGTEQKIVKQNVDTRLEQSKRRAVSSSPAANTMDVRLVN